jgi:predicted exporter
MLIGIEGADGATRARLSRELAAGLRRPAVPLGRQWREHRLRAQRDLLLAYRYVLRPNVTPARFTVEGLRAAISETVELLASPAGLLVKPLVARDPTGRCSR